MKIICSRLSPSQLLRAKHATSSSTGLPTQVTMTSCTSVLVGRQQTAARRQRRHQVTTILLCPMLTHSYAVAQFRANS
jgi:hypothetical protein